MILLKCIFYLWFLLWLILDCRLFGLTCCFSWRLIKHSFFTWWSSYFKGMEKWPKSYLYIHTCCRYQDSKIIHVGSKNLWLNFKHSMLHWSLDHVNQIWHGLYWLFAHLIYTFSNSQRKADDILPHLNGRCIYLVGQFSCILSQSMVKKLSPLGKHICYLYYFDSYVCTIQIQEWWVLGKLLWGRLYQKLWAILSSIGWYASWNAGLFRHFFWFPWRKVWYL